VSNEIVFLGKRMFRQALLFFFVFGIPIVGLPFNSSKLIFLILFGYYIIKNKFKMPHLVLELRYVLIAFSLIVLFTYLVSLLHYHKDLRVLYMMTLNLIEHVIGSLLFYLVFYGSKKIHDSEQKFIIDMIVICMIQSIIILLSLFFPNVSDFFISLNKESEDIRDLLRRYNNLRGHGFASGLTFDLSVVLSFGIIFMLTCAKKMNFVVGLFVFMILTSAIMVAGRTGFVFLFLYFVLIYLKHIRLYLFGLLFMVVILFTVDYMSNIEDPSPLLVIIRFAFEPVLNIIDGSGLNTASTDRLLEMWSKINQFMGSTVWYGDGYWRNPLNENKYYMGVDAGFLRMMFFGGLFFTTFIYSAWFITIIAASRMSREFVAVTLLYLVIEFKGSFVFGSGMTAKVLYIWLCVRIMNYEKKIINNFPRVA
jgi:hypothetical protein